MSNGTHESTTTTVVISTAIILVMVLVGLAVFGISTELNKARQMAGLSVYDDFDPDRLPAPAAGNPVQRPTYSVSDCQGILHRATENGTHLVRESGGGVYYAAEVDSRFTIYTLSYGHLVQVERSGLDASTYRRLKHALYHCDGTATRSGLYVARTSPEDPQV